MLLLLFDATSLIAAATVLFDLTWQGVQRLEDTFAEIAEVIGFRFGDSG